MSRAHAFANDLCRELSRQSTGYDWIAGWPERAGHEKVDAAGVPHYSKMPLVLVEVELRRGAPSTNIVKVWKWVDEQQLWKWLPRREKRSVVLLQAFSAYYKMKGTEKAKSLNAKFLGSQMKRVCGVTYVPLQITYDPQKYGRKGAGARRRHAFRLARRIARLFARRENRPYEPVSALLERIRTERQASQRGRHPSGNTKSK